MGVYIAGLPTRSQSGVQDTFVHTFEIAPPENGSQMNHESQHAPQGGNFGPQGSARIIEGPRYQYEG